MARNLIKHDSIADFLEILATFGELHGPALTDDGVPAFRPLGPGSTCFSNIAAPRSPEKAPLPSRDAVLFFTPDVGISPADRRRSRNHPGRPSPLRPAGDRLPGQGFHGETESTPFTVPDGRH